MVDAWDTVVLVDVGALCADNRDGGCSCAGLCEGLDLDGGCCGTGE